MPLSCSSWQSTKRGEIGTTGLGTVRVVREESMPSPHVARLIAPSEGTSDPQASGRQARHTWTSVWWLPCPHVPAPRAAQAHRNSQREQRMRDGARNENRWPVAVKEAPRHLSAGWSAARWTGEVAALCPMVDAGICRRLSTLQWDAEAAAPLRALAVSGLVVHGSIAGLIRLSHPRSERKRPETEQRHGCIETMGIRLGRDACVQLRETIGLRCKVSSVVVVQDGPHHSTLQAATLSTNASLQ